MDHDKNVDLPEGRCDRHEEVASDDGFGVVSEETGPLLIAARAAWHRLRHVLANGTAKPTGRA
jgi:hypothetical protein